jgi:lipoprotein-anchoring transpeptidase ErfK/SrfK
VHPAVYCPERFSGEGSMTDLPRRLVAAVAALLLALAAPAASADADAATQYIYISKQNPQRLYLLDGGQVLFESPVNTGIRAAPTPDGRFRIFASVRRRTMKGTDPRNGRRYNDKNVPYVMYFDGGMAIHGFYRRSYGYPQSFGCVELPVYKARQLYRLLDGGTGTEVVVAQRRPQIQYAGRERPVAPSYPNDASYGYFLEAMRQ